MYLDAALFLQHRGGELDAGLIRREMGALKLEGFLNTVLTCCESWFGVTAPWDFPRVEAVGELLGYTLDADLFGKLRDRSTVEARNRRRDSDSDGRADAVKRIPLAGKAHASRPADDARAVSRGDLTRQKDMGIRADAQSLSLGKALPQKSFHSGAVVDPPARPRNREVSGRQSRVNPADTHRVSHREVSRSADTGGVTSLGFVAPVVAVASTRPSRSVSTPKVLVPPP